MAIALLIVGGLGGAVIVGLAGSRPVTAISTASTIPTDDPEALPTDDSAIPGDSSNPGDSVAPVSPILEGRIPATIGDIALTVQSAVDATAMSSGPDGRALNAAVVHLGKQPSDLEIAYAYDESGTTDLVILGFRVDGIAAKDVRAAVLSAWLSAGTAGVTSSGLDWSGTPVTKVSYGDDAADEYVMTIEDSVFVLETLDPTIAKSAAAAIVAH